MRYIGPPTMKETVEGVYNRMRQDYTRRNPLIAVANVKCLHYHDGVAEVVEDKRSSATLERELASFTKIIRDGERSPANKKEAMKALSRITRYSSSGFSENCLAFYTRPADCVVLDPQAVFFLYFRDLLQSVDSSINATVFDSIIEYESVMAHELTHWDIGDTTPFVEMRHAFNGLYHGKVYISRRGDSKMMGDIIKDGKRFLKKIDLIEGKIDAPQKKGEKIGSRAKARLSSYMEDIERILRVASLGELCEDLGISMINEAVAYSVGRRGAKRMAFRKVAKNYGFNASDFRRAYEYFQGFKKEHGIPETTRRARSAIEESWDSKRKVTDVLGLK